MADNLATENDSIPYTTDVIVNGRPYFQSLAHQLADFVCKKTYEEFRLTADYGFTSATIYLERIISKGGAFTSTKYGDKKCIGVILFDIESNRMILRKTNVDRMVHEFHADGNLDDCFGVQYEIFKYLRDSDIIQIHTTEKILRKKISVTYRISKYKALKNGRFLHFKGHGTQFFIPIADFIREEGKPVKRKRAAKKCQTKK